jgi:hypothetical protein
MPGKLRRSVEAAIADIANAISIPAVKFCSIIGFLLSRFGFRLR